MRGHSHLCPLTVTLWRSGQPLTFRRTVLERDRANHGPPPTEPDCSAPIRPSATFLPQRSCRDCFSVSTSSFRAPKMKICVLHQPSLPILVSDKIHESRQSQSNSSLGSSRYHSLTLSRLMDDLSDEHRAKRGTRDALRIINDSVESVRLNSKRAKRFELT